MASVVTDGREHRIPVREQVAADLIVRYLERIGVDYVFGVPGGAIEPLFDALARSARRGGPRVVVARHETGAAFMAEGYARQTGRLGVCCATTGPGSTNMVTGVASAHDNHVALLAITGQTPLATFGKGAFQESSCTGINTVGIYANCTRYNSLVSHQDQLEQKLVSAIMTAVHAPSGPAHLSIPLDVLRGPVRGQAPSYDLESLLRPREFVDEPALAALAEEIGRAHRPVFVIGDECHEAAAAILDLAMLLDAPVVTTPDGKGLVSPWHPLFRGVIGFAGHAEAHATLQDPRVDLVVAVGTDLSEWSTGGWDGEAILTSHLVHVEYTASNLTRSPMARLHVAGSFDRIFASLIERFETDAGRRRRDRHLARARENLRTGERAFRFDDEAAFGRPSTPITPQYLMNCLARAFPPSTKYFADTGNSVAWVTHYLEPPDRRIAGPRSIGGGVFRACVKFASMGWAIGVAVGCSLAYRDGPVVCVTGDGSVLMSGQELTVAVEHGLPLVFVILNDSALGMVKHGQRLGGAERIGYRLPAVDFAAIAQAMGACGYRVSTPAEFEALDIEAICRHRGPTVLDVRVDGEQVPPMGTRMKVLRDSR
ncbi:MAG TPA: thiamine pyrophosphate-binding protein [Gammaproteobacteria bacterium]|nr:thiamine pyrophosphate-binding protein [Gammaproteobacteria bacterium]